MSTTPRCTRERKRASPWLQTEGVPRHTIAAGAYWPDHAQRAASFNAGRVTEREARRELAPLSIVQQIQGTRTLPVPLAARANLSSRNERTVHIERITDDPPGPFVPVLQFIPQAIVDLSGARMTADRLRSSATVHFSAEGDESGVRRAQRSRAAWPGDIMRAIARRELER